MTSLANQPRPGWRAAVAKLRRNPAAMAIFAALAVAAAVILLRTYGWLQPIELLVYDRLLVASAGTAPSARVVLVGAAEHDITEVDAQGDRIWGWPLRDAGLAALLTRLMSFAPRAIGVDLYRDLPEGPGTAELAAVMRKYPQVYWVFKLRDDAKHLGIPAPKILRNGDQVALADMLPDHDGIVRRGLLFASDGKNQYPTLGMALALAYLAHDHISLKGGPDDELILGRAAIELLDRSPGPYIDPDASGYQLMLDYRGGIEPFKKFSLDEVMQHPDRVAPLVRDRVVIFGVAADSVHDGFATPFNAVGQVGLANGIVMHALLVDQLIREAQGGSRVLKVLPRPYEDLWILVWALAGGALGKACRSTLWTLAGGAAGLSVILGGTYLAFGYALLLPAVPAAIAWVGGVVLASNRIAVWLQLAFSLYLSRDYIKELLKNPEKLRLGGEIKPITVMFCDIRGFTSMSESLVQQFGPRDAAEELASLINGFLTPTTDIIMQRKGTIDKYIGDATMAFWNAPVDDPDHAKNAVAAAQLMRAKLVELNMAWAAQGRRTLDIGIGINTGECMVGNFGSRQRMNYSLLGDPVNLASRLEGQTKTYHVDLIIAEDTAALLDDPNLVELDMIAVKGRTQPVRIYTLPPHLPEAQRFLERHGKVLDAYRHRDWAAALGLMADPVLATSEIAPLYGVLRQRIEQMQADPPPEDWDGVFVAHEK